MSRSTVGAGATVIDAAFSSQDVVWAGRVVRNPLHRLEGTSAELVRRRRRRRSAARAPLPG